MSGTATRCLQMFSEGWEDAAGTMVLSKSEDDVSSHTAAAQSLARGACQDAPWLWSELMSMLEPSKFHGPC